MKSRIPLLFILLLLVFGALCAQAQRTRISGKIIDNQSGDAVPFANVYFEAIQWGTVTDFDGFYTLETTRKDLPDTLTVSYVGYTTKKIPIQVGQVQTLNIRLESESSVLEEIEIIAGEYENPAWAILREVIQNKTRNDKRKLTAYQHSSYTKIEVDVDKITEKFRKRKVVQKIIGVLDSIEALAGEDGNPILPVFISESLSDFYYRTNPKRNKEYVHRTRIKGIGIQDGSIVSQLIGSTYQDYNFYENWMTFGDKDFISPIADSWRAFYDYRLIAEGEMIDGTACARISFQPKSSQDLAFTGTIWISEGDFALKQIDLTVGKEANLNFIEKIKLQQSYARVVQGGDTAWLPAKTRLLIDIGEIKDDWAGMLAKVYSSNENFVLNDPKPLKFFEEEIEVNPDYRQGTEEFWQQNRYETLTREEQQVYQAIDTIQNLPVIRTYVEIASIAINGYKKIGKVDVGSYLFLLAYNNIEGLRPRLRLRTNADFSRKVQLYGALAYGTQDQRWKYNGGFQYLFARKPWTIMGAEHHFDLEQVAFSNEEFRESDNYLFKAATRWGNLDRNRPFLSRETRVFVQTDLVRGITQRVTLRSHDFDPLFSFAFTDPTDPDTQRNRFTTSELIFQTRISFREHYLFTDLDRVSLGSGDRPIFTLRYTLGLNGFLGSTLGYQKISLGMEHSFRAGVLGRTSYQLLAGYIPSNVPYPLLRTHLGNESFFFNTLSFNLMNYFEFVSDTYASLSITHRFEGFFLNRIPLMRRLKWRSFVEGNVLMGSVRAENLSIIPSVDTDGNPIPRFNALGSTPYVEFSYGIENILKFIRVQAIHRLTYRDAPGINRFGVKVSTVFRL
ncbi:MAG: DUF5686 family protein [Bernardetiaceae bacterium]